MDFNIYVHTQKSKKEVATCICIIPQRPPARSYVVHTAMKAAKAMKAMTKAKKVSKVAKGRGAKAAVLKGKKEKVG